MKTPTWSGRELVEEQEPDRILCGEDVMPSAEDLILRFGKIASLRATPGDLARVREDF